MAKYPDYAQEASAHEALDCGSGSIVAEEPGSGTLDSNNEGGHVAEGTENACTASPQLHLLPPSVWNYEEALDSACGDAAFLFKMLSALPEEADSDMS